MLGYDCSLVSLLTIYQKLARLGNGKCGKQLFTQPTILALKRLLELMLGLVHRGVSIRQCAVHEKSAACRQHMRPFMERTTAIPHLELNCFILSLKRELICLFFVISLDLSGLLG